jgi:UDP-N-acetyl-D-glucosamine dehydrogenase
MTATHPTPQTSHARILAKIADRSARVGIFGLGYVGLPLARAVAGRAGLHVLGFDIDDKKIEAIAAGRSYIKHIPSAAVAEIVAAGRFSATSDLGRAGEVDIAVICVPTPLDKHREPDLSFVVDTAEAIARCARPGQLIILESTTYPGTTRDVLVPIFTARSLVVGEDIFLAFSPEREDPGNLDFETATIPKIVGGEGTAARDLAVAFYATFVQQVVPVSSSATAEAIKLTENIFRAVNIALVNELKVVYAAMGIDIWEVIEGAKTKPFGYTPFYPGPGLGGHCIPIDPFYLTWKAREHEIATRFVELAGEINTAMPRYVVDQLALALDERLGKGLKGSRILVVGLAYKKNVDDTRESPSLKLIELIEARGGLTDYHDPFVAEVPLTRKHGALARRRSQELTPDNLATYDAVLIATDHDEVDYAEIVAHSKIVVDTRNVCARRGLIEDRIVKA